MLLVEYFFKLFAIFFKWQKSLPTSVSEGIPYEVLGNLLQTGECKPKVHNSPCEVFFHKKNYYLFIEEGRRGVAAVHAAPISCGSLCVSSLPVVNSLASIACIWPRYRRPKFWNYFFSTKYLAYLGLLFN